MRISDWSSDVCSSDLLFWVFLLCCVGLWYAGGRPPEGLPLRIGQFCTVYYFVHFLILMPLRSEERRVGKSVSVRVDLGGRRIINKKTKYDILIWKHTLTHKQTHIISTDNITPK